MPKTKSKRSSMTIYHLSMECYPVAKVGGLADVVGALPKYQNKVEGIDAKVVIPWYNKPFVLDHQFGVRQNTT